MGTLGRLFVTAICAAGLIASGAAPAFADEKGNLTDFSSMTAIAVKNTVVRGIPGGGFPWAITAGNGTVSQRGAVDVTVTGLVIPALGGINPVKQFEATVSCIGADGLPHNVSTGGFDATRPGGNSHITATVSLPRPCKDPIVFVGLFPSGNWFAMSNPDAQP
jgi:hypothetical protein